MPHPEARLPPQARALRIGSVPDGPTAGNAIVSLAPDGHDRRDSDVAKPVAR